MGFKIGVFDVLSPCPFKNLKAIGPISGQALAVAISSVVLGFCLKTLGLYLYDYERTKRVHSH